MKISNKKIRLINCPMDNVSTIFRNHGAMFAIMMQCSQSWCNVPILRSLCNDAIVRVEEHAIQHFCTLVCICSMSIPRTVKQIFQYGVKQLKVPHEILDCLKGVVHKDTQVGCGQALS